MGDSLSDPQTRAQFDAEAKAWVTSMNARREEQLMRALVPYLKDPKRDLRAVAELIGEYAEEQVAAVVRGRIR